MIRKPLSKRTRFDVFKRDEFTCQYCGQKPPAVVLEVDHVIAVAEGGGNDETNLLTACFDCNRGKAAGSLNVVPIDLKAKAALLRERMEQTAAYEDLLREQKSLVDRDIADVVDLYESAFPDWSLTAPARQSIKHFLTKLPASEVRDAMEMAVARMPVKRAFKYFCGVCWRKIKDDGAY
jgi:hypothetical protein